MDEHKSQLELLFNKAENYFKTSIELYKLKLIISTIELMADLVSCFVFYLLLLMSALFASIALAFWIGHHFCSQALGFFIVSLMYVFITMIFTLFKNKLIAKPIRKKLVTHLLKSTSIE